VICIPDLAKGALLEVILIPSLALVVLDLASDSGGLRSKPGCLLESSGDELDLLPSITIGQKIEDWGCTSLSP
jgi:hypothetical protein